MNEIKEIAMKYKLLYNSGKVTREEALSHITPYIEQYNKKSAEVAKKYGVKPKKISFASFIR